MTPAEIQFYLTAPRASLTPGQKSLQSIVFQALGREPPATPKTTKAATVERPRLTNKFAAVPIAPRSVHRAPPKVDADALIAEYFAKGGEVDYVIPLARDPREIAAKAQATKRQALLAAIAEYQASPAPAPKRTAAAQRAYCLAEEFAKR